MGSGMSESSASERRVAIVVASMHHGNTRKIAEAMAKAMDADVMSVEEVATGLLEKYAMVGFGSGIYFGRHHSSLVKLVDSIENIPGRAFIFSTAGLPFLTRLFHWPLRKALMRHSCRITGEFTCRGWDTVGPLILFCGINRNHPNAKDLQHAVQFGHDMMKELDRETEQS